MLPHFESEGSFKNVGSKVSFAVVDQGEGPSLFFKTKLRREGSA